MSSIPSSDTKLPQLFLAQLGLATRKDICSYFSQYGNITKSSFYDDSSHCLVSHGYIIFSDFESAEKALGDRPHTIKDTKILCRPMWNQPYKTGEDCKKFQVFIKGFSNALAVKSIKDYFNQYGEVFDVAVQERPMNDRRNGLAFVTFMQRETVAKVLAVEEHSIEGIRISCQRFISLQELRSKVPRINRSESWSKEENCREQPRTALIDEQTQKQQETADELVQSETSNSIMAEHVKEDEAICPVPPSAIPAESTRMAGVQTEQIGVVGRGRGASYLLKLKLCQESSKKSPIVEEPTPDWDNIWTSKNSRTSDPSGSAVVFSLASHCTNSRPIVFHTRKEIRDNVAPAAPSTPPMVGSGRGKYVAMLNSKYPR